MAEGGGQVAEDYIRTVQNTADWQNPSEEADGGKQEKSLWGVLKLG